MHPESQGSINDTGSYTYNPIRPTKACMDWVHKSCQYARELPPLSAKCFAKKGNGIVLEHIYTLLLYVSFNFDTTQNAGEL